MAVFVFLKTHWDGQSPLLLGYSGGPDSKALLYALLQARAKFEVAHVDHGWREESANEALEIQRELQALDIPFHTTRLSGCLTEESAREARLAFFGAVCEKRGLQAVLLAHHADDLAETALKRVLEGAHLPFLAGMEPVSEVRDLLIWRPLLSLHKADLEDYLAYKTLSGFSDPTNRNPAYLRSRMRLEMIPYLDQSLGKKVAGNLRILSERSSELKDYLNRKVQGKRLTDLKERLEQRYFLQVWAMEQQTHLPRDCLESLLDALAGQKDWKGSVQGGEVILKNGDVKFVKALKSVE